MRAALAQYQIVGVRTNVEFLGRLMRAPSFVEAKLDTALIEREREHLFAPRGEAAPCMWEMAAQALWQSQRGEGRTSSASGRPSPWDDRSGWALGERGERRWNCVEGEVEREVAVRSGEGESPARSSAATRSTCSSTASTGSSSGSIPIYPPSNTQTSHGGLLATMPGRVLAVLVKAGDEVAKGAPLVVLEAMKMEQTITAPSAGKDRSRAL